MSQKRTLLAIVVLCTGLACRTAAGPDSLSGHDSFDSESLRHFNHYSDGGAGAGGFHSSWVKDIAWPRGTSHIVRFEAAANTYNVYLDGSPVGSVDKPLPYNGGARFGLRHYGNSADWHSRFHDFGWSGAP